MGILATLNFRNGNSVIPITKKSQSNSSQNKLKVFGEFGACSLKALAGVVINFL